MENFTELVDNLSNFSFVFLNLNIFFQLNLIVLIFDHEKLKEEVKKAFC